MAQIGTDPLPNTPAQARAALDKHLPVVLRGRTMEEVGWIRSDLLTLLIPVFGVNEIGKADDYLLKLHFGYYPEWPPSAQFVNPETKRYVFPEDIRWLPRIEGTNEISVHTNNPPIGQLICCSVTLEFYQIKHGVEARHLWDPARQNFAATLNAIERGLRLPYYKGRQA